MGSGVVEIFGELTGRFLDETIPEEYLSRWYSMVDIPLATGVPMRLVARGDTFDKSYIVGEHLCAPLRTDDGEVKLVLTGACFDGTHSWTEVIADERQRLGLE